LGQNFTRDFKPGLINRGFKLLYEKHGKELSFLLLLLGILRLGQQADDHADEDADEDADEAEPHVGHLVQGEIQM